MKESSSYKYAPGRVASTNPSSGAQVARDSEVTLVLAQEPTVHSTGEVTLGQNASADLDQGTVVNDASSDIRFQVTSPTQRNVVPLNDAKLLRVGTSSPGAAGCATATLGTTPIPVAQLQAAIEGIPVRRAMIEDFVSVRPESELREVADHILRGFQTDYPVVDEMGKVVGVLPQAALLAGLSSDGPAAAVGRFMRTDFKVASPGEMLDRALARLQEGECPVLPVQDGEKLVGLLTTENIGELVMIREAIKSRRSRMQSAEPVTPPE